jgi:phosphopantothenoylcysteine decarboxylase/phosphopantothenate--cysteine ligase
VFDDRDVEIRGSELAQLQIDLVVTGGIAAIESPRLARELRRYGADVRVIMTPAATKFIGPVALEWASKNPVITDLSGAAEHITQADAVVVAPATLDFISKIALGLADSAAATLVQSALARRPVLFAPSMHLSLEKNPIFQKNLESLRSQPQVKVLMPDEAEGKAKMLAVETMVAEISHFVSRSAWSKVPVVISLGPTRSYADAMRFLSNRSTGRLGLEISSALFRLGADVFTVAGPTQMEIPKYLCPLRVETNEEMRSAFQKIVQENSPRVGIFSAAVLDFEVANPATGKFSSKENWELKLRPSPKLIQATAWPKDMIRVGFKLESSLSVDDLKLRARKWAEENACELLVANRLEDVEEGHRAFIWVKSLGDFVEVSGKKEIAVKLCGLLEPVLKPKI